MIVISNFDTDFKGRQFKDTGLPPSPVYTAVGYGDNHGNPYLVGLSTTNTNQVILRTILIKNIEFIPTAAK